MRPVLPRLLCTLCALALPAGALSLPAGPTADGGRGTPRLDAYGDPLPPGATARFGSLRWRLPGTALTMAVSPDNKRAAAVDVNGLVIVWDMATGRQLHILAGSAAGEGCLAFSPDGRYLATGGRHNRFRRPEGDFRVRVWDVRSGKEVARFPQQQGPVGAVAFSPDGAALVSGGAGQPVTVWTFPGGVKRWELVTGAAGVQPFALAPDGRRLAVAHDAHTVALYSFDRGVKLWTVRTPKTIDAYRFSADGRSLLTEESDALRLWEVAAGQERLRIDLELSLKRHAFLAPDGRKVALLHEGPDIRWLHTITGKPAGRWSGFQDRVSALAFTPGGRRVVSAEAGGALRVWDAAGKVLHEPSGPAQGCRSLVFTPDGKTVLAGGADLHLLDGRTLRERARAHVNTEWGFGWGWPQLLDLSPDGTLAAAAGAEGEIFLVDPRGGKLVRTLPCRGWHARSVGFGPGAKKLYALGSRNGALRVWDVDSGKEDPPLCTDLVWASNLAVAPAAGKLAVTTGGRKPRCRLWDLRTGQELPSLPDGPDNVLLSHDGKLLAAYHHNSHLTVWDLPRRVPLHRLDFRQKSVTACAFSPDGRLLITGHTDRSFSTWDLADGKKRAEVRGHPGAVVALACSPDGTALVSACTGCTVLRWEAAAWKGK
jgi:WD40 repeat protein